VADEASPDAYAPESESSAPEAAAAGPPPPGSLDRPWPRLLRWTVGLAAAVLAVAVLALALWSLERLWTP